MSSAMCTSVYLYLPGGLYRYMYIYLFTLGADQDVVGALADAALGTVQPYSALDTGCFYMFIAI